MERRVYERIGVDAPVVCQIVVGTWSTPVLLKDISRGGVQVEIGPGKVFDKSLLGQAVTFSTLADELTERVDGVLGVISWLSKERLGIRFDTPLSLTQAELQSIIGRC